MDIDNPLSMIEKQTRHKKQHFTPSTFVKFVKWLVLRGMNGDGKLVSDDDAKTDTWKHVANSDRLIKKYAGDVFADTCLDDGLHSIVHKDATTEEKE